MKTQRGAYERLHSPQACLPIGKGYGGAGRVRWSYPRPRYARELAERLQDLLCEHALVAHREDLPALGLPDFVDRKQESVGSVVAIALDCNFPTPYSEAAYDHGSIMLDELLVPFAVYSDG